MAKKAQLWLHGISGKMGSAICQVLPQYPHISLLGGSGRKEIITAHGKSAPLKNWRTAMADADLILDFSNAESNAALFAQLDSMSGFKPKVLIGSTGLTPAVQKQWEKWCRTSGGSVLLAPNTSLGVFLLAQMCAQTAKFLAPAGYEIHIHESHHSHKKDAPSGTALMLRDAIEKSASLKNIPVTSCRAGGIVGEHEVRFVSGHDEITLSHRAFSRSLFAVGAVTLAEKMLREKKWAGKLTLLRDLTLDEF